MGVRIPLGDDSASINLVAFLDRDHRTVRQLVALTLAAKLIRNSQLSGTGYSNQTAIQTFNVFQVMQTDCTTILDLNAVSGRSTACRTTDVEGPHGQLRTRLTNRLSCDDTDGLADVDLMATCQIAPITFGTDSVTGFTGDWRAGNYLIDTVQFDELDPLLINQGTSRNNNLLSTGLENIFGNNPTEYALTQRLDNIAAFNMRRHQQTTLSAAVNCGNHQVLRHIHQTTGQITRVGRLQGSIRQTFTRTVSRDEVLQYVQAFTEVGGDRRLDDRSVRLGHQATHTGQLANLRRTTTSARVSHHVHRVKRFLIYSIAFAINDLLFRKVVHHRLGDFIVGLRPEVDHLVVLLALGYQARSVLRLDLFHFRGSFIDDASFLIGDDEVVYANRNTGNGGIGEPGVHQLISKDNGIFQADRAIALVNQLGDRLFLH